MADFIPPLKRPPIAQPDATAVAPPTKPAEDPLKKIAAARAIVAARAAHPDLTPDEVQQIAQSYGQEGENVAGYLQSLRADHQNLVATALRSLTGEYGADLTRLVVPDALGGSEAARQELKLRTELAKLDHPFAGNALASLGPAVATAATADVFPAITAGGRVASAAATAGAAGGTAGAVLGGSEGDSMAERIHNMLFGGATGTVLGGVLGSVAGGAAELGPKAAALKRQLATIEASGGMQRIRASLEAMRNAGRGSQVIMADLSPQLQSELGDFAMPQHPSTFSKANTLLDERQFGTPGTESGQAARIGEDVTKLVGTPDAAQRARELLLGKREWANTAYDALRNSDATFTPEDLSPFLEHPKVRAALAQARLAGDLDPESLMAKKLARIAGEQYDPTEAVNALNQRVNAANGNFGNLTPEDQALVTRMANGEPAASLFPPPKVPARPISFTDLQQMKRALDGKVGTAYRAGNVPLANAYTDIRDAVRNAIVKKVPDYAAVDAEYAAKSKLQDVLQQGVSAWKKSGLRDIEDSFNALSPDAQNEFRHGLASKLVDWMRDAGRNENVARNILLGGQSDDEKLRVIFGTEQRFDDFINRAKSEATMAATRSAGSGSATARRVAGGTLDAAGHVLGSSLYSPHAAGASAIRSMGGAFTRARNANVAGMVGHDLLTQGADRIDALLTKLTQPVNILGHTRTVRIGQAAGSLPSLFDLGNR